MSDAFSPCGHEPLQSASQLHGVCIFCYRNRLGSAQRELSAARQALRIISGEEQCVDNLLGDKDVARAALAPSQLGGAK